MRVLVTGGAGRLGITVCQKLLNEGFGVRVFDLDTPRNRRSMKEIGGEAQMAWGDITSRDSVARALDGVGAVVHMAGILPPVSEEQPALTAKVNVEGTRVLVDLLKGRQPGLPFVFTSSVSVFGPTPDASRPISVEKDSPRPEGVYARTKLEAEEIIRQSGVEHVVLRLSAAMYTVFTLKDMKMIYSIPADNRVEMCHPEDAAVAIVNAISRFQEVKGNTLVVSGGPDNRMLYGEMVAQILDVMSLPVPPTEKFIKEPYYLDWYDTGKSQELLSFQHKGFKDYLDDYRRQLSRRFSPLFLPFMSLFVGPLFGKAIVRFM